MSSNGKKINAVQLFSSQNNMNAICGQGDFARNNWEAISTGKIGAVIKGHFRCAHKAAVAFNDCAVFG